MVDLITHQSLSSRMNKVLVVTFAMIMCGLVYYYSSVSSHNTHISEYELDLSEFQSYLHAHKKFYFSYDEFNFRFSIFRDNLAHIRRHNKENEDWVLGVNKFADLTSEEFKNKLLPEKIPLKDYKEKNFASYDEVEVPNYVNWVLAGAVTPVQTQGNCGSHWAFSAAGAIESIWNITGHPLTVLSAQQLVDCSGKFGNKGCNGGFMDYAFQYVINNTGLSSEQTYPYVSDQSPGCNKTLANITVANITKFVDVLPNNTQSLIQAIAQQPVSIAVEADQTIWQFYKGGVISRNCGNLLDHGVLAVGYSINGSPPYYLVKNSWGTDWGENGYIRIAIIEGEGVCGIQIEPSYPIV